MFTCCEPHCSCFLPSVYNVLRPSWCFRKRLFGLLLKLLGFPAGKSALHWAAAVNNVEATLVLLKNGANRDMQDNKVQFGCAQHGCPS